MPQRSKPEWMRIAKEMMEETRRRAMPPLKPPDIIVRMLDIPKYCPRCNGNMLPDGDGGVACLMCGEYIVGQIHERKVQPRNWPPKGRIY